MTDDAGAADPGGAAARFPAVTGRSLLGAELVLPRDFPAERTLVVVAFRQWHQARVDRWIARAVADGVPPTPRGLTGAVPTAVVELPVLATRWRPVRRFIDGGMTSGIGDPDVLARTITIYTDVGGFQRSLGVRGGEEVHALVVTRDGTILARGAGDPVDREWDGILAALRSG
ncbi:MAG TPA: hypothetical protein VES19_00440 [Candidatus Limnocylindrales bacterium]|nr:hypothetical protein [Candidatus Limnocylindrales bacterium]